MAYATPDQVRTYLDVTIDQLPDEVLTRPITQAERDIDAACGGWAVFEDTRRKFETANALYQPVLWPWQEALLADATAAQVEYRLTTGDEFMVKEQYESQSGPGYSTSGQVRKVCGAAYTFLGQAGLLHLHGKASNRGAARFGDLPRAN